MTLLEEIKNIEKSGSFSKAFNLYLEAKGVSQKLHAYQKLALFVKVVVNQFRNSDKGSLFFTPSTKTKDYHIPLLFLESAYKTNLQSAYRSTIYWVVVLLVNESFDEVSKPIFKTVHSSNTMIGENKDKPLDISSIYKFALLNLREYTIKKSLEKADPSFIELEVEFKRNSYLNAENLFNYFPQESDLDMIIPAEIFTRMFFLYHEFLVDFHYKEIVHTPLNSQAYSRLMKTANKINKKLY